VVRHAAGTKLVIAALSTVLALLIAEALARIGAAGPRFGQLIFVRGVPSRTVDGVPLWDDEHPRSDAEDIRRAADDRNAFTILGLGDSIMYGVWQSKEDTYLEHTRRVLAPRTHRAVEILNLAVPGYNTRQEAAVYKELDDRITPDLVIVHHWVDDVHQYRVVGGYVVDVGDVSEDGSRLVVRALPVPPRLSDFLLVHSRLYDLLTQAVVAFRRETEPTDWTRVSDPLADIHDRIRRANGKLLVLASPDFSGPAPKPDGDLGRLQEFAANRGIDVIDLAEWLRGASSKEVALDSCHFNAEGHRRIGKHLAEYLLQHQLTE
jgi:lysophospholipase L1-like esterase